MCWWNLDNNIIESYYNKELQEIISPYKLIIKNPSDFPKKSLEEYQNNYIDVYDESISEFKRMEDLFKDMKNPTMGNFLLHHLYKDKEQKNNF